MAKSRATRKRATGYTVGNKPIRRRKLNGARKSRRRRMNGAGKVESIAKSAVAVAIGSIAGGAAIHFAKKFAPNFYVRAGGAAVLGVVIAKYAPKMREVGIGVSVAGLGMMGAKALSDAGVLTADTMNAASRKTITPAQMKALTERLKAAGALNGSAGTLNATPDGRAIITGAHQMFG